MTPNKKGRLKVEYVPIRSVKPAKGNTRAHPPEQIQEIARSIEAFGWTKPIIVDEKREILAGHGAYQAALQLGHTEVPIIGRQGLSQAQKRAYRTADNKIGENSAWDMSLLGSELASLKEMGFDMTLTGFTTSEIDAILRPSPSQHDEPPVPQPHGQTVSRLGDIWVTGEHRLICGDSTKPATYQALLDGRQAAMVFTDPPYGVSYQDSRGKFMEITGDKLRRGQLRKMLHDTFSAALPSTTEAAPWYIWHASITREDFALATRDAGLVEPANGYIVWVKPAVLSWTDYKSAYEPCFYVHRQGTRPAFYGDRTDTTVWRMTARAKAGGPHATIGNGVTVATEAGEIYVTAAPPKGKKVRHVQLQNGETLSLSGSTDQDDLWDVSRDNGHGKEESIHPTQKPVELARRAIKNSSLEGEGVLDMFAGSGSTLIGCEQLKRTCYAIELDPQYVDAIVRRWQTMTGKQATHAKEKKTFEAIAKARASQKEKGRAA